MKILMVCLGNICRSPLAEGVLRQKAINKRLSFEVDSCGTADYHIGEAPDIRSIKKAAEYGIDISQHKGRQLSYQDFENFDKIFVMDTQNYKDVIRLAKTRGDIDKVQLMMGVLYPNDKINVPDPYYGDYDGFEEVYQMLDKACETYLQHIMVNEG